MPMTDATMEMLISRRLGDIATRCEYHCANGDIHLAKLLQREGYTLADAYDNQRTILVAEALF